MTVSRTTTAAVQFQLAANPAVTLTSTQNSTLQLALSTATNRITALLNRTDRTALLTGIYATAGTPSSTFNSNLTSLFSLLSSSGLKLVVEVRSASEMNGAAAAFAPNAPGGVAKVYLNADLLSNGTTSEQITWLILEQFGQAVDRRLNGNLDATGDEGKAFAAALTGRSLTDAEQATLGRDAAGGVVTINGTAVAVESEANQGPSLSANASNASFSEAAGLGTQAAAVAVFSNAAVSVGGATERWQTITAFSLRVAGVRDGANERLWVDGTAINLGASGSGITSANGLSWSVSLSGDTATLSFSRSAGLSAAATAALINAITYQNSNADDPTAGARTITLTSLSDSGGAVGTGTGVSTPNITSTINVLAVNDGPSLSAIASNSSFTEAAGLAAQAASVAVFSNANVSTVEAGQSLLSLGFAVSGLRDGNSEVITVDGTSIRLGAASSGTTAGSLTGSGLAYTLAISTAADGSSIATLSFSSASGISANAASSLLNGLSYQNTNLDNPTAGARSFTLTSLRDSGGTSVGAGTANGGVDTSTPNLTSSINVVAVNDAPLLGSLSGINLIDTTAQDVFSATVANNSLGSLAASDPEGSSLSYGLDGASAVSASFDGISYSLAKVGTYGTLYLNSSTGQYRYQPRSDWQLNAFSLSGSESFNLSVSDGSSSSSTALLVNFTGSSEAPEQYVLVDDGSPVLNADAETLWEQALTLASRYLSELLSDPDCDAILADVFARAGTDPTQFEANKQALLSLISGPGLQIDVDLRTDAELNGAAAAYAAIGHTGKERIYVNGDKINNGQLDVTLLTSALLEEYGHALDQRLNQGVDSPGDEGQLFASQVTGLTLTAEQRAVIDAEDDSATLTIEAVQVLVEEKTSSIQSATLGNTYSIAQTITPTTANAISFTVTVDNGSNDGADILIAAYNNTTLIGWSVYDRTTNLQQTSTPTLTFDLEQFNTSINAGNSTNGFKLVAWQGTYNGSSSTNTTTATVSGTSSTVQFTTKSNSYSSQTTVSGTLTGNNATRIWAVNTSDLTTSVVSNISVSGTGFTTINLTSNEAGTAGLYNTSGGAQIGTAATLVATTANTLAAAAQSSLTSASLTISDAAGNTTSPYTVYLGTTTAEAVTGSATDDILYGFDGNDTIDGGTGDDIMIGGAGTDVFITSATAGSSTVASGSTLAATIAATNTLTFINGVDIIADFTVGTDVLRGASGNLTGLIGLSNSLNLGTNTGYYAYGTWNTGTKVFTLQSNTTWSGTNNDVIFVVGDSGSLTPVSSTGYTILTDISGAIDTTAPTVTSFTTTTTDGSYKAGSLINITANTSEAIQAGGQITVTLDTGDTVTLTATSAGSQLTGTYNVPTGKTSADLTVSRFTLGTGANAPMDTGFGIAMSSTSVPTGASNIAGVKAIVIDTTAPTVSDSRISISGASGTSGAYKIGDTVTATWTNTSATGDNNTDINIVTVDFSQFGCDSAVAASNNSGTWTATYTIGSGSIDSTSRNVSVTATDNAGNITTTADSTGASVDNIAPTVTDANISISGGSGTGGTYKIGDTVTAVFNPGSQASELSAVTVDFSQFGGGSAVAASLQASGVNSGMYVATYTIGSGSIDSTSRNVSVTATDNAGNITTTADSTGASVDNIAPTVTDANISISGGSGTGGTYKIGDTVTAVFNPGSQASELSAVTVDFSQFGGGSAVAASLQASGVNSGMYVATYTIGSGSIDSTSRNVSVTATDNAGNITTTADSTGASVDNIAPTVTDANISISGGSGTGGTYKIGDTVTAVFNPGSQASELSAVTVDFSQFGGGSAVAASLQASGVNSGMYVATYTIGSGSIDSTSRNVSVTATDNAGNITTTADSTGASVDNIAPTVTDANISISGGSGTGGTYKIGDTVTAVFNPGSQASELSAVTVDFSQFGGGSAVAASLQASGVNSGMYVATYTIGSGSIDSTSRNVSVTATDNAGNITTTADSTGASVDNIAPTVTDANISISGGSGTGGTYKIGDTVTAVFNPGSQASELSAVTVDFSQFGGGSAVAASLQASGVNSGMYVATYTIGSGSIDSTSRNVSVTATDNAGNITTTADSTGASVDNIAPTVTDANISISGGSGTGGTYKIGDTVTAVFNPGSQASELSAVTVDFSQFGGGSAVAASLQASGVNSGMYVATYTIGSGSIDSTSRNVSVTATDNAGNITTTADSTGASVDNIAPTVTDANISISGGSGTGGTYKIGDTVTAVFNPGSQASELSAVTVDFSQFGGGSAVAASLQASGVNSGMYVATYTIGSGSIDSTSRNVSVTATDNAGNITTTADSTGASVDNIAPTVTDANISISGGSGTGGTYKIGDTVTAVFNPGSQASELSAVTVDFSQFGGGSAVAASLQASGVNSGMYVATYTIGSGSIDSTSRNVSVTATDNAGNITTTADSTGASVDNIAPTVTDANISISGGSGTGGTYKIGDTVTAVFNPGSQASELSAVTVDFSQFGGGSAVAASLQASGVNSGMYVATYTIGSGSIDSTSRNVSVTATDNAGNITTTADSTGASVDNIAPTLSLALGTGVANGATAAEAQAGALNITAENGAAIAVTFSNGANSVIKPLTGTGSAQAVTLSAANLTTLGNGAINVSAVATDAAGNTTSANNSFNLDSVAPTLSGISFGSNDGNLAIGESITLVATLSEAVNVSNTTTLVLNNGASATYSSGSGSKEISFLYTSASGQSIAALTTAASTALRGTVTDLAGNAVIASGFNNITPGNGPVAVDTILPALTTISYGSNDGNLAVGETITLVVTGSEALKVSGTPSLALNTGGTASYVSGSGSNQLMFSYTVGAGQSTDDLATATSSALSGTITDLAGNAINPGNFNAINPTGTVVVDTTAPSVSAVVISSASGAQNGQLNTGDKVAVTVTMSEAVIVNTAAGTPQLSLNVGGSNRTADYASGSGSTSLVFTYTIAGDDSDLNGISIDANSLALNGGAIRDLAGNTAASLSHAAVSDNGSYVVNNSLPQVTAIQYGSSDGNLAAGEAITLLVDFDETVQVSGTPSLLLNTGGSATYSGGSNSSQLSFSYTPAAGQSTADLATAASKALSNALNGSITDLAGNAVVAAGFDNINPSGTVAVDAIAPQVASLSVSSSTGTTLAAGSVISVTVVMSEAVSVSGTPTLTINLGGAANRTAAYVGSASSSTALVFRYTIASDDPSTSAISIPANSLATTIEGSTIRDAAGNNALLSHQAFADGSYVVDNTAPTVASLAISAATGSQNNTLNTGDVVFITATLSEVVNVTGTPQLALNVGGISRTASYVSGSGSNALLFSTTVQSGDSDSNGLAIDANAISLNGGTIKDIAGNNAVLSSGAVSDNGSFKVDTTAPTISNLAISSATSLQNSTLNAGDVVNISVSLSEAVSISGIPQLNLRVGNSSRAASYVSGSGSTELLFAYTIQAGDNDTNGISLEAGSLLLNGGSISDAAGNAAVRSYIAVADNGSYKVDTTAPDATVSTSIGTDGGLTGTINSGGATRDNTLAFSGTANDAGGLSKVEIYDGATYLGDATLEAGAGTWTYATPANRALSDGDHSFTARVTDLAGNVFITSAVNARVDTTAPGKPSISFAIDDVVPGTANVLNGGSTNDNTPTLRVSLQGSGAVAGDTVQLLNGATVLTSAMLTSINISDNFINVTPTLNLDGTYILTTRLLDAVGNVSQASSPFSLTIDRVAPSAPSFSLASDTGSSPSDGITQSGVINVTGLETANSAWQYSTNGGVNWFRGSGSSFTLANGSYAVGAVQVRQADLASNLSAVFSNSSAITVDNTAPTIAISASKPSLGLVAGSPDTSTITFVLSEATSFSLSAVSISSSLVNGVSTPDGTLSNLQGSGTLYTATFTPRAELNGTATFSIASGVISDLAGNTNSDGADANNRVNISVNTLSPSPSSLPTVSSMTLVSDSGTSGDWITNVVNPTISGSVSRTLESNEVLQISLDNGSNWQTVATSGTSFSVITTLSSSATVRGRIAATSNGNTTTGNEWSRFLTIDTATYTGSLSLLDYSGNFSNGSAAGSDNSFALSLANAEPGATISYQRWNGSGWDTLSGASQTDLVDGSYRYRATATDAAGNTATSAELSVAVDRTAPNAPTLSLNNSVTEPMSRAQLTASNGSILVSTSESGATVTLTLTSDALGSSPVVKTFISSASSQSVVFSSSDAAVLGDGTLTANVTITDPAGNSSSAVPLSFSYVAQPVTILGDLSISRSQNGTEAVPTPSIFTLTRTGDLTSAATVKYRLSGTAVAGTDYTAPTLDANGYGSVIFAAGASTASLSIATIDNSTLDTNARTLTATLIKPEAYNLVSTASTSTSTLVDNETSLATAPEISFQNIYVAEGSATDTTFTANVFLSKASTSTVTATYSFRNGTASGAGVDYLGTGGTVTFNPGATRQSITFTVKADSAVEANETFYIDLTSPSNATFTGGASTIGGLVTILNDDSISATDPTAGIVYTLPTPGSLIGSDLNDNLLGSSGSDLISAGNGNDTIAGLAGSDTLTGGRGTDRFAYSDFSQSTALSFDSITDFQASSQGDRIAVSVLPTKTWFAGSISNATSLSDAIAKVCADVDRASSSDPLVPLGDGDAVIFRYNDGVSLKTYLMVDDASNKASTDTNLFLTVAGLSISSIGQVASSTIFATS